MPIKKSSGVKSCKKCFGLLKNDTYGSFCEDCWSDGQNCIIHSDKRSMIRANDSAEFRQEVRRALGNNGGCLMNTYIPSRRA